MISAALTIVFGVTENWHILFGPLLVLSVLFLRGGLARRIDGTLAR